MCVFDEGREREKKEKVRERLPDRERERESIETNMLLNKQRRELRD